MSLIKAFQKKEHAKNFIDGFIRFRNLKYYKFLDLYDPQNRGGDKNEGRIIHKHGEDELLNEEIFILCMHNKDIDKSGYGNFWIEILDPDQLLGQIQVKIQNSLVIPAKLLPVIYYNKDYEISNINFLDIPFHKDESFKEDKEYRIMLYFRGPEQLVSTEDISFNFYKFTPEKDDEYEKFESLEEWKDSKGKSKYYGKDHFVEIEISNIKFDYKFIHKKTNLSS